MASDYRQIWESAGGSVPAHWQFLSIKDLLAQPKAIAVGVMYPGIHTENGTPLIRVADVKNGKISKKPDFLISSEVHEEYRRTELDGSELLITLVGNPGDCVIATPEMSGWNAARALAVLKLKDTSLRAWIRYVLLSYPAKHLIDSRLNTTVQKTLNLKDIKELAIPIAPLEERNNITYFIENMENKIELNRQMNATLESMVQALFKSWFVDFDPVLDNALAVGNPIPDELQAKAAARLALGGARKPLPAEIQALFPNAFVLTEEMGWIPEGWNIESMTNMVDSISETYPLKKVDKVVFLNTGDILDGSVLNNNYSSNKGLPGQAKKSIKKGDILYSEIRPQNKRFAYIDFDGAEYVVSTKLMVLRAKAGYDPLFCYFILKQDETINLLQHIAETRSGTFPQITFKELDNIKFAMPSNKYLVAEFGKIFLHDYFRKFSELQANSRLLANLRNTLLPKLLSGELRITDAESYINNHQ